MTPIKFSPIVEWPGPLTRSRRQSQFKARYSQTQDLLDRELFHLGAKNVVIQLAVRESEIRRDGLPYERARPQHPGVILSLEAKKAALSFPCDTFTHWQDNLRGIALALESLRRVDRYGVTKTGEQYRGWAALPAPSDGYPLTVDEAARELAVGTPHTPAEIIASPDLRESIYRDKAKLYHPDNGGDAEMFKRATAARSLLKEAQDS